MFYSCKWSEVCAVCWLQIAISTTGLCHLPCLLTDFCVSVLKQTVLHYCLVPLSSKQICIFPSYFSSSAAPHFWHGVEWWGTLGCEFEFPNTKSLEWKKMSDMAKRPNFKPGECWWVVMNNASSFLNSWCMPPRSVRQLFIDRAIAAPTCRSLHPWYGCDLCSVLNLW